MAIHRILLCCAVVAALGLLQHQAAFGQRGQSQPAERRPARPQASIVLPAEQIPAPTPALPPALQPIAGQPVGEGGCRCVGENADTVDRIKKVLASPLHARGIEHEGTSLEEVVQEISSEYNIPIKMDIRALDSAGQGPGDPVKIQVRGGSLRSALRQMLRQLNLTSIIVDEVVLVTTPTEAEAHLRICLYDVRDLVVGPARAADFDTLIDTIESMVTPETWAENGGVGEIRALQAGMLTISQTEALHEEIGELLGMIRQMMRKAPVGAAADWRPPAERVVTKSYPLSVARPENLEAFQKQLRDLIVSLVPEQPWNGTLPDGQPIALSVLPDRIIVRHRPAVQQQVEALLIDIGMTPAPATADKSGGGQRGGTGFFQPQPGR